MVGFVSKVRSIIKNDEAEDIAVEIQQWRELAGVKKPVDMQTLLRMVFRDIFHTVREELRRISSDNIKAVQRWWD
jgi:hypothetical protein